MNDRNSTLLLTGSSNWLARAAFAVLGVAIVALAFFFLTIALVVGAAVALVFGVRLWWVMRRIRAAERASGPIEGEYSVVDRNERLR
jgi:heme A synthase